MIIHLNGWPGVGKYSVGKELSEKLGARFIHNHLLHDVAFACAGRDDDDRWPLYEKIRSTAYEALVRRPSNEVFVITNALCVGVTREIETWSKVVELAIARSVRLIPVILKADIETIAQRISCDNRSDMKLKDPETLREMISMHSLQIPDIPETIELDVSHSSIEEATDKILLRLIEAERIAKPVTVRHNLLK